MTYRVRIDPVAQGQIDHFAKYLFDTTKTLPLSKSSASTAFCIRTSQKRRSRGATFL